MNILGKCFVFFYKVKYILFYDLVVLVLGKWEYIFRRKIFVCMFIKKKFFIIVLNRNS